MPTGFGSQATRRLPPTATQELPAGQASAAQPPVPHVVAWPQRMRQRVCKPWIGLQTEDGGQLAVSPSTWHAAVQ